MAVAMALLSVAMMGLIEASPASAEEIYVLTAGGTAQLEGMEVRTDFEGRRHLDATSPVPLSLTQGGLAIYSDLVVLPGGHLLLGDGSGRGAVRFNAQGEQMDQLFEAGQWPSPPSVVAAGFLSPNDPDLLVLPDASTGHLRIYDRIDDQFIWNHDPRLGGGLPFVARAIAMPDQRIGAAMNWSSPSIAGVQVMTRETPPQIDLTILSQAHEDFPDAAIIDALYPLRDLMADIDGRLLITSQTRIAIVDPGGQLSWHLDVGDSPALSGEFESATWLASGAIVAATRQPGLWNQPHTNHRLHLIDPSETEAIIDSSDSLSAAPLRVEPAAGLGGTGTRDYAADAFDFDEALPSELEVVDGPAVEPDVLRLDEQAQLRFEVTNPGELTIPIRRTRLVGAKAPCAELDIPQDMDVTWWLSAQSQRLDSGDSWGIDNGSLPADALGVGTWCAQLIAIGRDGRQYPIGDPIAVEIAPPQGTEGPVHTEELAEFDPSDAGVGDDTGPANGDLDDGDTSGCSCTTASGSTSLMALLILLGLAASRRTARALGISPSIHSFVPP